MILWWITLQISSQHKDVELHSTHAGSMGGILALKANECHAAPVHLLAENGDYNIPYLKKYLPGEEVSAHLCRRAATGYSIQKRHTIR